MGMFMHWTEEDSYYAGLVSSVSEYGSSKKNKSSKNEVDTLDVLIALQPDSETHIETFSIDSIPWESIQCEPVPCEQYGLISPKQEI